MTCILPWILQDPAQRQGLESRIKGLRLGRAQGRSGAAPQDRDTATRPKLLGQGRGGRAIGRPSSSPSIGRAPGISESIELVALPMSSQSPGNIRRDCLIVDVV